MALLHFLWESARLHTWVPRARPRTWGDCRAVLIEQARACRINARAGIEALWIPPAFRREQAEANSAAWARFLTRLAPAGRTRLRGLVLGEIRSVEPSQYGERIHLAHQRGGLFATTPLMERVRRSYPHVFGKSVAASPRRQIVLCVIERSRGGHAKVIALAAMLTTQTYVPVDSMHEADMADALVVAGRTFVKPLCYEGQAVFPDFVLIDSDPETYVEVWGVTGRDSYEKRKRAKQKIYHDTGRRLLEWDVAEPLPELSL
ncbi:hypothetical protein GCM10022247_35720 [Allokutzneria multivorans]|uniref:Uncharacterized protein n=1 Tax=Allokutzneria multivorans TaxID=1142134 RepID=A0ABP7SDK1_9PSEU